MSPQSRSEGGASTGLRTRYRPRVRLARGFVSVAPWLDVLLLLILYVLLSYQQVIQPGVIVEMPSAPFEEGSRAAMIAVVISVPSTTGGRPEELIFFDDERFRVRVEADQERLRHAVRARIRQHPDADLVIQSDRSVRHGTVMDLMGTAYASGVARVNLATREN